MTAGGYDIDLVGLMIALGMAVAASLVSAALHLGVGRSLVLSSLRALLQLCAMGLIIRFIIRADNPWLVLGLVLIMLVAAVQITLSRAQGIPCGLAFPVFLTLTVTMVVMVAVVAELIVRPDPWYSPQLLLPLTGMMLGNCVSAIAVAMTRFYESMDERREHIGTMLALGATPWECARPSIVSSMRLGLLPTIASLSSAGIVTIPGMMAGQVIAGGDPLQAAKYQFVVLAAIAGLTLLADALIMLRIYRSCFTDNDQYHAGTRAPTNRLHWSGATCRTRWT
ncbi:ABC transporter permease [uncultured Bifidobacterium sp.]|uniref:ABC transporter permease n=1 Tax=uncultured Bifidobacterium sp. TaxID=165187 RepID=UPI00261F0842|nr:ABC transporter permease [uncultured Bifidobacterium sp.]